MKTLALFLVLALTLLTIGCEDSAMTRYSANPVATAAPGNASKMKILALAERYEVTTPDGKEGFLSILGEIKYQVTEMIPGTLPKALSMKPVYNVKIEAEGEINPLFMGHTNALGKPGVWTFKGSLAKITENGSNFLVTFDVEGTNYQGVHLHLGFRLEDDALVQTTLLVDFQGGFGE